MIRGQNTACTHLVEKVLILGDGTRGAWESQVEADAWRIGLGKPSAWLAQRSEVERRIELFGGASLQDPEGLRVLADRIVQEDKVHVPDRVALPGRSPTRLHVNAQPREKALRSLADVLGAEAKILIPID